MRFLVDGYNFAHRAGLFGGDPEAARRRTLARLQALARGGDRVTVVWDARHAPPGAPGRSVTGSVEETFAREGSADEEILRLVRDADAPRELCVITDDLEVSRPAKAIGAAGMSVKEAVAKLGAGERHRGPRGDAGDDTAGGEKPPLPTEAELDEWEKLFGREEPGEETAE
jgi:predicted RNA-binding protein with PIN domain